ncbi:hypothetical protein [Actinoplanes sp. NPDC049599]|uniref:hypothetical protein n=1 Tax=Actinoplanes sp. NPDC049599 TaxID=3363903 RepID=UPI0037AC1C34
MRTVVVGARGRQVAASAAGRDVTFLVRPARAAQLAERGLRTISPAGEASPRSGR